MLRPLFVNVTMPTRTGAKGNCEMIRGLINMGIGLLVGGVGLAITFGSYAAVSGSGGHYTVAWGAVVFGALQFVVGFIQFVRGLFTKQGRATLVKILWPQSRIGGIVRLGLLAAVAGIVWIVAPESWKTISPESLRTFSVKEEVKSIAYSPDGKWIAVAPSHGVPSILDASTGAQGKTPAFESYREIQAVAFSPDGRLLAAATSSGLRIWSSADWSAANPILVGQAQQGNYAVAISPDGKKVATGSVSKGLLVWNAASGAPLWQSGTGDSIDSVAFSRDGSLVASGSSSGSWHGEFKLWNSATGALVRTLNNDEQRPLGDNYGPITALAFFRDGRLASGGYGTPGIVIFDSGTGTLLRKLQNASPLFGSAGAPWSIAISPDDRWITSGNTDRSIRIWDAKTYSLARSIFGHAKGVSALAFSPDGHEFASGGADHVVKIWASP
jgi:WD40 repeat protein